MKTAGQEWQGRLLGAAFLAATAIGIAGISATIVTQHEHLTPEAFAKAFSDTKAALSERMAQPLIKFREPGI